MTPNKLVDTIGINLDHIVAQYDLREKTSDE